jgi:hypothetical protein
MEFTVSIFKLGVCWYCHTHYHGGNVVTRASEAEWRGWKDPQRKIIQKLCSAMGKGKAIAVVGRKMAVAA